MTPSCLYYTEITQKWIISKINSFTQQICIEHLLCAKNYLGPGETMVKKMKHLPCIVVGGDWQFFFFNLLKKFDLAFCGRAKYHEENKAGWEK